MNRSKSIVLLTLCALFWAGNYIFGRMIAGELTPAWLSFFRWFFAAPILLVLANKVENPDWRAVASKYKEIFLVSLTGFTGYNLALYTALKYTAATNAALITTFSPALMSVVSFFVLGERLNRIQLMGIFMSLVGVLVILSHGDVNNLLSFSFNTGDLLMFVAVALWITYTMQVKKASVQPLTLTASSAFLAAGTAFLLACTDGFDFSGVTVTSVYALIYIVIFPSVCAFIFWSVGVREVGASMAGIFLNLVPVFTAIAAVFTGDSLRFDQLLGGAFVLAGVGMMTFMNKRCSEVK